MLGEVLEAGRSTADGRTEAAPLHTFIAWAVFLRALAEKRNDAEGWEHPARRLGTTRGRLARFATKHCGNPLPVLEAEPLPAIDAFERSALGPLGVQLDWSAHF